MGVAAELDPEIVEPQHFPEAFRPEKIGAAFVERDHVFIVDLGENPFLFAPNPGAVGPLRAFVAVLENLGPAAGIELFELFHVVLHLQERTTFFALINDLIQRIGGPALRVDTLEPGLM